MVPDVLDHWACIGLDHVQCQSPIKSTQDNKVHGCRNKVKSCLSNRSDDSTEWSLPEVGRGQPFLQNSSFSLLHHVGGTLSSGGLENDRAAWRLLLDRCDPQLTGLHCCACGLEWYTVLLLDLFAFITILLLLSSPLLFISVFLACCVPICIYKWLRSCILNLQSCSIIGVS